MDDSIVSVEAIRAKARSEYKRGAARDGHGMKFDSPAIGTWQDEWDRCAAAEAAVLRVKPMLERAQGCPP